MKSADIQHHEWGGNTEQTDMATCAADRHPKPRQMDQIGDLLYRQRLEGEQEPFGFKTFLLTAVASTQLQFPMFSRCLLLMLRCARAANDSFCMSILIPCLRRCQRSPKCWTGIGNQARWVRAEKLRFLGFVRHDWTNVTRNHSVSCWKTSKRKFLCSGKQLRHWQDGAC